MDKERNEEQEFLKDVDRFLNGEEATPDEDTSEDARSAIEFARKLSELRAEPSPEFQESLKSKLLRKLTEQEVAAQEKAGANWPFDFLGRLIPQSQVWRTAAVTVAIVMVATGVMWGTGIFTPTGLPGDGLTNGRTLEETSEGDSQKWDDMVMAGEQEEEEYVVSPPPVAEGGEFQLEIEISFSEATTRLSGANFTTPYGDEVTLTLVFTNTGPEPVMVDVPQVYITDSNESGLIYIFPAVDGPIELSPLEPFHMRFVWEQHNIDGDQVASGVYIFNLDTITVTRGTESFEISPPSVIVTVLEP